MSAEAELGPSPELKTYHGNCHCGAIKFRLVVPEITSVTECNCSICFKKGYKYVFPGEHGVIFDKGEETLKDYTFGPHTMNHRFCPNCGTGIMGKRYGVPPSMDTAINVRTLLEIDDLWALKVNSYDGTGRDPQYVPPPFTGKLPTPNKVVDDLPVPDIKMENPKTYTGACHCGNVTLALVTNGSLPDGTEYIQECNCSICARNGTTLIYPHNTQVSIISKKPLSGYSFAQKFQSHKFCPVCGVAVCTRKFEIDPETWAKIPQGDYRKWFEGLPVNLRLFEGVEWTDKVKEGEKSIEVKRGNWKYEGEPYVVPE